MCRHATRNTITMHLKRKDKVDIYWSFKNPFINPQDVCNKYKISTFEMQKVINDFQREMDKKYKSKRLGNINIEKFCYNLRNYNPK